MKRHFVLYLILCCSLITKAQWDPFPINQISVYTYKNTHDTTINLYYHDSVVNHGTHQTLHFDYSTPEFNGCYEAVNHASLLFAPPYIDNNRPDSIIKINDTLFIANSLNNDLLTADSILFLAQIQKDSSWFSSINNGNTNYNTLKFTCDSIYLDTIIDNVVDSVKKISIQTYQNSTLTSSTLNGLKIILSKNYGLKQYISFYKHPNSELPISGINSSSVNSGFQVPQFSDYFHLNIGDVIIWKKHLSSTDIMIPDEISYFKDSITSVSSYPDSIYYSIKRTHDNGSQSNTSRNYSKRRLKGLDVSTSIFLNNKSVDSQFSFFGPEDLMRSSPISIINDSTIVRRYAYEGVSYNPLNCIVTSFYDVGYGIQYNTYYGLTSYGYGNNAESAYWTIEGAMINGVQSGNFWNVGIYKLADISTFNIYPNPSNGKEITISGNEINTIKIFSLQGQLIQEVQPKQQKTIIDLENKPKGIYFIQAMFSNGSVINKKLILTR